MWNKIKQIWHWLLVKTGFRKSIIIKRTWPYADNVSDDSNLVYLHNAKQLESVLSRKFNNKENKK